MNSKNVFIDLFVSSGMYSWLITQKIAALTYMSSEKYVQFDNSCQYWFIWTLKSVKNLVIALVYVNFEKIFVFW